MTTNARDENWSEWKHWSGGSAPIDPTVFVEIKTRDGDIEDGEAVAFYWLHDREPSDIIAYRYKIKEPESEMHPDLEWLARNVSDWIQGPDLRLNDEEATHIRRHLDRHCLGYGSTNDEWFTKNQWLQARKDLGLIMSDAEEEMRAEEWNGYVDADDEPDNVNKPKHYQLREGYEVYDLRQDLAAKAANGGATYDQYSDWDRAIEYIIRMWGKNRLEDAKKGRWYLDKLIGKLEAVALEGSNHGV